MASIRKTATGKYEVQIRRKGFSPVCRSFHNRSDAVEWSRHMEVKADRGELPTPLKVLHQYKVRHILERYRDEVSVKKRSYNNEKHVLNRLIRQSFSDLSLAEITSNKFSDYRDARIKVVQPGTIRRELALLKHAFDIAQREWDMPIKENPLNKLARVKPQAGRTRRLSDEEYAALEKAIIHTRNPLIMPMIRFAIATGMRRGEILRILWTDIDFEARTLHIPVTKNGHARTIPLSSHALAVLRGLSEDGVKSGERPFHMTEEAFKLAWQRLRDRAMIKDLHFHDLRHEAISRFFEKGLLVPEVALISGHRDIRMLMRYTHLKPENIVEKLG